MALGHISQGALLFNIATMTHVQEAYELQTCFHHGLYCLTFDQRKTRNGIHHFFKTSVEFKP